MYSIWVITAFVFCCVRGILASKDALIHAYTFLIDSTIWNELTWPKTQKYLRYHKHCHIKSFLSSKHCFSVAYTCLPLCAIVIFLLESLFENYLKVCLLLSALFINSLATSIKLILSNLSFCTWSTIRWFILLSVVVDLKYVGIFAWMPRTLDLQ